MIGLVSKRREWSRNGSLVSPGQRSRRRGFRRVLEVLSFLTSVIRTWEQGSLVPISSSAGGSPQESGAPINRWCWGGRRLLVGTVTCSIPQTADERLLVILKKASSHLWRASPPNSLSKDREERMATKGIQILPKQSIRHGRLNKDLKIERKDHPEYLQSELAGQQEATATRSVVLSSPYNHPGQRPLRHKGVSTKRKQKV